MKKSKLMEKTLSKSEFRVLCEKYKNDLWFDESVYEWWFGLYGTTTIKVVSCDCDEDGFYFIEYGITQAQLREDNHF